MYFFTALLLAVFMVILFAVLTALILFVIFPLKAAFSFSSELQQDFHIVTTWLGPLLKALIYKQGEESLITIYLFNQKVLTKNLIRQTKKYSDTLDLIKTINPEHIKLQSSYGFEDPSITGMVCGTFDMISQYINLDDLYNNPDFNAESDYFNISAEAEIYLLPTLLRLIKTKKIHSVLHPVQGNK